MKIKIKITKNEILKKKISINIKKNIKNNKNNEKNHLEKNRNKRNFEIICILNMKKILKKY